VIGIVGSRYAREDKKKGIFGYKRCRVPVNKASLFKFHDVDSVSLSSVPHEIATHEGAVPVPFRHRW
jgi:hypothetical protein